MSIGKKSFIIFSYIMVKHNPSNEIWGKNIFYVYNGICMKIMYAIVYWKEIYIFEIFKIMINLYQNL
jgi:hypothetical protein